MHPTRDVTDSGESHDSSRSGLSASVRRVALCLIVAVPATVLLTALLLLVAPNVAIGVAISGLILFQVGKAIDRPLLLSFGGVVMFAGVFSWAVQQ